VMLSLERGSNSIDLNPGSVGPDPGSAPLAF
jgi:hypothetical protein